MYTIDQDLIDKGEITKLISFGGGGNKDNNSLIYCNERGLISIYDLRIHKPALCYNTNVQRGLITCMEISREEK